MKAFTIGSDGTVQRGIALHDGMINLGRRAIDWRPFSVSVDPSADVDGTTLLGCRGNGALVYFMDQAGPFSDWRLRGAYSEERWDKIASACAITNTLDRILENERIRTTHPEKEARRCGWYEFARGFSFRTENARPELRLYGYLEEGASIEIRRIGKTQASSAVTRVSCVSGDVIVCDPLADAVRRLSLVSK